ncbi:sodium-dependent transporter [Ectothiorhodospiraceae bacterium 2226]|nr:sodium-dependent transporter [Ectothiorhodospiraceae bacterium 2226]
MTKRVSIHGQWSSRWAFILAATGSAVGLGNIWKFPYIAGENGGGAFVLVYLLCIVAIGVPTMMAEILLGRRGRQSPINTMQSLAAEAGRSPRWRALGWLGVLAGVLILSYYSVVAGWALAYIFRAGTGAFTGIDSAQAAALFESLTGDPQLLIAWHTTFMALTILIVSRGVRSGLESAVKVLMPVMLVLLLVLVGYALNSGAFQQGIRFMFSPNFAELTATGVLVAMGHAFFTLSLGMGAIMVYGSYLSRRASIARTTFTIAALDTLVAVLAGMAIFPIVFASGLQPGEGPGLVFLTLPISFGQMPWGAFFGTLFFILLAFAAWTSAISLLEPAVAWLVETVGWKRSTAALATGTLCWFVGLGTVFSFNVWSEPLIGERNLFGIIDFVTSNIMLPLGGLLIAVFAGWVLGRDASRDELALGDGRGYRAWRFFVRYVTPLAVGIVFLHVVGVLDLLARPA